MCRCAELLQEAQDFLLPKLGRGTIPHAQAPQRRKAAAPGEQVVPLHGMPHVGTGKDVHVHAPCRGNIHADELRARFARAVQFRGAGGSLLPGRRSWCKGRIAHGIQVAEVEAGVAGRIHVDAVAARGHVKRHRRVRVAEDRPLVVADADGLLPAQQLEYLQVHAQAVELLARFEGQFQGAAASAGLEPDGRDPDGKPLARLQCRHLLQARRMLLEAQSARVSRAVRGESATRPAQLLPSEWTSRPTPRRRKAEIRAADTILASREDACLFSWNLMRFTGSWAESWQRAGVSWENSVICCCDAVHCRLRDRQVKGPGLAPSPRKRIPQFAGGTRFTEP